ncbi:type I secretion system permease/ATPase [Anaplasmataceae bacterium AB001_6]|nr:type I secretion system permease/ATPase [Anaplasmataceae bacterium AB001_6]
MFYKKDKKESIGKNFFMEAIKNCRTVVLYSFIFSFFLNMLVLFIPVYTSQVLDRVISSGSLNTLMVLFSITFFSICISSVLESCRSIMSVKVSEWLDTKLSSDLIRRTISSKVKNPKLSVGEVLRDFSIIKNFLTSPSFFSIMDLPWTIIYILVLFMIHKYMGFLSISAIVILSTMAFINNRMNYSLLKKNNENMIKNIHSMDNISRNFEVLEGMGMIENVMSFWSKKNGLAVQNSSKSSILSSIIMSITKFFRNNIQIIVISLGAYLTVTQGKSCGSIIASSILIGRAVAPFDSAINSLSFFSNLKQSYNRIMDIINNSPVRDSKNTMIDEEESQKSDKGALIEIINLIYSHEINRDKLVLDKINLTVNTGSCVGLIGESGSGKSTLAKMIVGIYKPNSGIIKLNGNDVYHYDRQMFGKKVGYLPQEIELFNTTVKHNISRLSPNIDMEKVKNAAQIIGIDKFIESLPNGYDTIIGNGGIELSGGQKQLVGIARCFYEDIDLLVFDEPNSNLDERSDKLLENVMEYAKKKGITTFVMTHKKSILKCVDAVITLKEGRIQNIEKKINKEKDLLLDNVASTD